MAYFKIGNIDFSKYVNELKVNTQVNYSSQTNAAGNTVVDYINSKRTIEVGIIPVNSDAMLELQLAIKNFSVSISFHNPNTNELEEAVACIIPANNIEYYTIQSDKVKFKAFNLTFEEL